MLVKHVKAAVSEWVQEEAGKHATFYGAFLLGSITSLDDDASLPATSDVDVRLLLDDDNPPRGYHKIPYQGLVIEYSYEPSSRYQSPEAILGAYPLAHHFSRPNVIADPSRHLTRLQMVVAANYPKREWVRKRCEHAREMLLGSLEWLDESDPFLRQIFAWLYPAPAAPHMLLVADLQNPTIRRSLVVAKEILERYGHPSLHDELLAYLGSVDMSREQVMGLLANYAEVYEVAKEVIRTPFFESSTISDYSRSIAIDGARTLIESGFHREAVFWITFLHHACQTALNNDAPPEIREQFAPKFDRLLRELGISSFHDLQQRNNALKALVPRIWEVAEAVMEANPAIVD